MASASLPLDALMLLSRDTAPNSIPSASHTFAEMPDRDFSECEHLILRFEREGRPREALDLFRAMTRNRRNPRPPSLSAALRCCAALGTTKTGREIHAFVVRNPMSSMDSCCCHSSLINFYAKSGNLSKARDLFDEMPIRDVVAWTAMLMAYANKEGYEVEVMVLLKDMMSIGITPNRYTLTVVLRCTKLSGGEVLHGYAIKKNLNSDAFVGSALVDMYAKAGEIDHAQLAFDHIQCKDVVCYNTLLSSYGRTAIIGGLVSVFVEMGIIGLAANQATCVAVLNGCANFGFTSLSKQFHAQITCRGFSSDEVVQGVIVDMYSKSGDLHAARLAFDSIHLTKKSAITWNSMIGGYGKHGRCKEALEIFKAMASSSTAPAPNYITFICLLSACSHAGLIEEGLWLFDVMINVYKIAPRNEHYCCMVDLFGRKGMVHEAYKFICMHKCEYRPSVWGALLSACRVCGDAEIGEIAARRLFELEPYCSSPYVTLAGIYAANSLWTDSSAIRELMDRRGVRKDTGYSCIEVDGVVQKFKAGEGIDPVRTGMEKVYILSDRLNASLRDCHRLVSVQSAYSDEI